MATSLLATGAVAQAATITIDNLDLRSTGVFGHADATLVSGPGGSTADPLDWVISYTNLDLDGDGSANDTVNFTVRASGGGASQRAWGQGIDTGFGNLNNVTISVVGLSGTTTDSGDAIVFDGFTEGTAGMGGNGVFTRNVDINGTTVNLATTGGGFQFQTASASFAPTATILFDNSGGDGASIVARAYDLQFSTVPVPEPSSVALLGLAGGFLAFRRRK
ncbi:PEP-CTERM sorting domain-containing protein [Roseibacillus persicicus]|uniref:PEP-CTERM sorting domain-containing protein n=1 Tax=Roseibacillus persicicus TaxID=454148 RepID=UPI00398A5F96